MQISEQYTHNKVIKIHLDEKEIKDALVAYAISNTGVSASNTKVSLTQADTSTGFYYQARIELIVNLPPVEPPDESQAGEA